MLKFSKIHMSKKPNNKRGLSHRSTIVFLIKLPCIEGKLSRGSLGTKMSSHIVILILIFFVSFHIVSINQTLYSFLQVCWLQKWRGRKLLDIIIIMIHNQSLQSTQSLVMSINFCYTHVCLLFHFQVII